MRTSRGLPPRAPVSPSTLLLLLATRREAGGAGWYLFGRPNRCGGCPRYLVLPAVPCPSPVVGEHPMQAPCHPLSVHDPRPLLPFPCTSSSTSFLWCGSWAVALSSPITVAQALGSPHQPHRPVTTVLGVALYLPAPSWLFFIHSSFVLLTCVNCTVAAFGLPLNLLRPPGPVFRRRTWCL
jgi:hypothetical protein